MAAELLDFGDSLGGYDGEGGSFSMTCGFLVGIAWF